MKSVTMRGGAKGCQINPNLRDVIYALSLGSLKIHTQILSLANWCNVLRKLLGWEQSAVRFSNNSEVIVSKS
jgi:hypothetical protein